MPIFKWLAVKKDGDIIHQFNRGIETLFKNILDEEESILFFQIYDDDNFISVDLEHGLFYINGFSYHPCPELQDKDVKYRLVYYRRNQILIDLNTSIKTDNISKYIIGWQTTVDGINIQRLIFLDPETYHIEIKEKR